MVDHGSAFGALHGVRVVDLTVNVLGPVATQILGDMGADVIKVEPPDGDQMRGMGPGRHPRMSALYLNLNRNKRSVVLDLKRPASREAFFRLLDEADVFVHSMRPLAARRLGVDYAALSARYPRLVCASAPGYRSDGPWRDRPALDDVIQSESGLVDLMKRGTGEPRYLPTILADKLCGVYLALSIGMALVARHRTGAGQDVQVPMLETVLSFNLLEHLWTGAFGPAEGELGYVRALSPKRRPYATLDGHISLFPVSDAQWQRLFGAIDRPELARDPRFSTLATRIANVDVLYSIVGEELARRSTAEWRERLDAVDVPNGRVAELDGLLDDPYLRDTGFFQRYSHATEGEVIATASPLSFSGTPSGMRRQPPQLGQHTEEVLGGLGLGADEIAAIAAESSRGG